MTPLKKILTLILAGWLSIGLVGCTEGAGAVVGLIAVLAGVAAISSGGGGGDSSSSSDSDSSDDSDSGQSTRYPVPESVLNSLTVTSYDGSTNDLLTAGFGQTGLLTANPVASDSTNPTAAELRRMTIVEQFQTFQDLRTRSGYSTLYGPAVVTGASSPTSTGKVSGKEYLAYYDNGSGEQNVVMMLQIPSNFNSAAPCLVAAPAPESRNVYGAIATSGEWGLKNRCAVVYTDKGAGTGYHDLTSDTVNLINGTRTTSGNASTNSQFTAQGNSGSLDLSAYSSTYPNRIAYKHAHSQQNPEASWGEDVLNSLNFAFYTLNLAENYGESTSINPDNTVVLAAGWGSGGAAALRALEQDTDGWIDGVVVADPIIDPEPLSDSRGFIIQESSRQISNPVHSRHFFDLMTYFNLYQPCASATLASNASATGRCSALRTQGLLSSTGVGNQINEAQLLLRDYGAQSSAAALAHYYYIEQQYASLAYTYASAYGGFSVVDNLCDYSLAATRSSTGRITTLSTANRATVFADSNGAPPAQSSIIKLVSNTGGNGNGINILDHEDDNGVQDEFLDGARCLRSLYTGTTGIGVGLGTSLTGTNETRYNRVQNGQAEVFASTNLRNKAAIIVQGRNDPLANVNFHARAYYGRYQATHTDNSQLVYIEVKNAHHFDGYNARYTLNTQAPLHYYFSAALDRMLSYVRNGSSLPNSQVVATTVPSTGTLSSDNLPSFGSSGNCSISYRNSVLTVPDC